MKRHSAIDFVAQRRWPAAGVLLALVGASLLAWQVQLSLGAMTELERHRAGMASLQRPPAAARPAMSPEDIRRHAQMDRLSLQLATPWEAMLGLFEAQSAKDIVLLKFEPNAIEGKIELSGRAGSAKALGNYIITLENDARLATVQLHHHEVLRDATRGAAPGTIEFSIGALWQKTAAAASAAAAAASATSAASPAAPASAASAAAVAAKPSAGSASKPAASKTKAKTPAASGAASKGAKP